MRPKLNLRIIAALTLLIGCATQHRGAAYGHVQEFRQLLAESVPVKDWGYKIQDIRFSSDYRKALVIFTVPGKGAGQEVVLEEDDFRRYKGRVFDPDRLEKAAAIPGNIAGVKDSSAPITVDLPNK
jgi:hypothetical protein